MIPASFPASVEPAGSVVVLKSEANTVPAPETLNNTEPSNDAQEAGDEARAVPVGAGKTTTLIEDATDQHKVVSFLAAM